MSRLKEVRERRGLRREDLASRAGISYQYVRLLESEAPPTPSLEIARRVAEALDSTLDDLWPAPSAAPLAAPTPDAA